MTLEKQNQEDLEVLFCFESGTVEANGGEPQVMIDFRLTLPLGPL